MQVHFGLGCFSPFTASSALSLHSLPPLAFSATAALRPACLPSAKCEIPLKLVFPGVYELFCDLRNRLSAPDALVAFAGFLRKLGRDVAR